MSKDIRIVHGSGGDWIGIYIGRSLYHQGHDIPRSVWLELLGLDPENVVEEIPQAAMEEMGELPADYTELQRVATDQTAKVDFDKVNRR